MAVDMFLKLSGVEGESLDKAHGKEIDVLAWSWGASNSGSMHMGAGGGSGKVSFQDISVTKYVDKASKAILDYCTTGNHFKEGLLTVRKAGGKEPLEYIKIGLKEVMITSVSTGGSGGEDKLTENITLNFKMFKYEYTPQKETGAGDKTLEFSWNIAANKTS